YSSNATTLLQLLILSAIPLSINTAYITNLRVKKKIRGIVIIYGFIAGLTLGISYYLMIDWGLTGVGLGWLMGHSLVAIGVIVKLVLMRKTDLSQGKINQPLK
ncbi:MAG: hypothetical protein JSW28_03520, partial [Thermoplasmata archaeon]